MRCAEGWNRRHRTRIHEKKSGAYFTFRPCPIPKRSHGHLDEGAVGCVNRGTRQLMPLVALPSTYRWCFSGRLLRNSPCMSPRQVQTLLVCGEFEAVQVFKDLVPEFNRVRGLFVDTEAQEETLGAGRPVPTTARAAASTAAPSAAAASASLVQTVRTSNILRCVCAEVD